MVSQPGDEASRAGGRRSWVEAALGAPVAALEPLAGDASVRRFSRVRLQGTARAPVVLMEDPRPAESEGGVLDFLDVATQLAGAGVPVPRVLAADPPSGCVLLEDLGARHLFDAVRADGAAACDRWYRDALAIVADLQAELSTPPEACASVANRRRFDVERFSRELAFFLEHAARGQAGLTLGVAREAALARAFHALVEPLAAASTVFTHRDFHSRNLMLADGERLVVIDFQDARLGPYLYDVVSLLFDAYVDIDDGQVAALVAHFADLRAARGLPAPPGDEARHALDRTLVQRGLKAVGTFGFQAGVRGRPAYLEGVPRTLARVRAALARLDDEALEPVTELVDELAPRLGPCGTPS